MGDWYTIGLAAGLGSALGVLTAGLLGGRRKLVLGAAVVAAVAGALVGLVVEDTAEIVAGAVGGVLGAVGAGAVVGGAARRGGTRTGLALIVAAGAVLIGALAFVPVLGYVEAVVLPLLALRLRSRAAERYAGLRTLAK